MTYAVWPEELPRPERNSWKLSWQEARLKTQNETGPPSYRRRFSNPARSIALSLILTRQERAVFDNFFEVTTGHGSLLFYMPDPTTEGWGLATGDGAPLLTDGDVPIVLAARWLCSFGDTIPAQAVQGIEFRMTFSLWVLP
ncbi:hypothetical protein [Puniceibacterium sp. IMCC21224]|uniref:hypothetical protein n=1 Tax=Puniceibacterium sp. IMCC21224 TaxID=1618204 RepID=UPI00064D852C|nr:hypothetical protein [Puniceibacterium sp. IMCC21224]KMK68586.1 hypothetical protein IMCC21224_113469 [Puniceibacterium sp. IMCC21224]